MNKTNCPNCGAQLVSEKCIYCGTECMEKQKELKYFIRGREIVNPTEEMLSDQYLLMVFE